MDKYIEIKAKTLEEALQKGQEQIGLPLDEMHYEVVQAGSKGGLFGIGSKNTVVRFEVKQSDNKIKEFLSDIFSKMGMDVKINLNETDDEINIDLEGENMGVLIGRRGETLDALQYLTRLVASRKEKNHKKISIDIENYRKKREETLNKLAEKLADKVIKNRRSITLEPMNPFERKVIHAALQNNELLNTYSIGEEPNRKIVIAYKK